MGGKDVTSKTNEPADAELLDQAFENSLRGDPEALGILLSLIKTRYGKTILSRLRRRRGIAHTGTVEDVFQQSLVDFIEEVKSGALAELPASEREDVVFYFQKLCNGKLDSLRKARKDPLFARSKAPVGPEIPRDRRLGEETSIPGLDRKTTVQRDLMYREIAQLDPFDQKVLRLYLDKVPYAEIAKETGQSVNLLEKLVIRIKEHLAERVLAQSPTARLNLERQAKPRPARSLAPTRGDVRSAIEDLPRDIREAIAFVHMKGGTVEKLAGTLGDRGVEKAQARLRRGYESLSLKLDLPFPESFSLLKE